MIKRKQNKKQFIQFPQKLKNNQERINIGNLRIKNAFVEAGKDNKQARRKSGLVRKYLEAL